MTTCQHCNAQFDLTSAEKDFFVKLNLPEPKSCPDCRQRSRCAWRNERMLYTRQCDLCKKAIVSFYAKDKPYLQYCPECWWSDRWQAPALDYDPAKPFLEQFKELLLKTPHLALIISHGENSDYCPHSVYYKDSYMCISGVTGENIYYSYFVNNSFDSMDCAQGFDLQNCYQCVHCQNLFSGIYCNDCENSSELAFCYDCISCQNCIGCVGLRHKENYIFNKPATKEECAKVLAEAKANPEKFYQTFYQFSLTVPRPYARIRHCENSTGDYLYNCRNAAHCFESQELEDCFYVWNLPRGASAVSDINYSPKAEMSYNCISIVNSKYQIATVACWDCSFTSYSWQCFYSQNLFGCTGLKHGSYQILNKKYSETEYKQLKEKIIEEMKRADQYGEFFPIRLSPFCYNETIAREYFPLTKDEVQSKGWFWQNELPGTFGRETLTDIPADITQVTDAILNEILACTTCKKDYKIIPQELKFYRSHGLPIARQCFDCRHLARLQQRNPRTLYHRACMNAGCTNEFETTYAPERPERVYCEECYQKEIY
ncbi:hypothetical protein HY933_04705 [Candidatus Falkowbacteria bacterium]|nr:hypothetical protein [Candidatus Falkowbacteria bacterium]